MTDIKEDADEASGYFRDRAAEHGVEVEEHITAGEPARAIRKFVEDNDIDLVVMGSHGRSGLKRVILGSVTEKVLRRTRYQYSSSTSRRDGYRGVTNGTAPTPTVMDDTRRDERRRHPPKPRARPRTRMFVDLVFALAWVTAVSVIFDVLSAPQWAYYLSLAAGVVAYYGFFASLEPRRERSEADSVFRGGGSSRCTAPAGSLLFGGRTTALPVLSKHPSILKPVHSLGVVLLDADDVLSDFFDGQRLVESATSITVVSRVSTSGCASSRGSGNHTIGVKGRVRTWS